MTQTTKITSRENSRLADVRKVRESKRKEYIFIEGTRLAEEALRSGLELTDCVVSTSFLESGRGGSVLRDISARGVSIAETPDRLFSTLADTVNSQGLILIAKRPETGQERLSAGMTAGPGLFVFLFETNDPSNLGAVLRTAEAAGVSGVITSNGSTDAFSPKALRAGMGSTFRVPIWDRAALTEAVEWALENDTQVIAADISGNRSYTDVDWIRPSLVVFGSEADGLSKKELAIVETVVRIPMNSRVESLNLAVSAGIILFEAVRQRSVQTNG